MGKQQNSNIICLSRKPLLFCLGFILILLISYESRKNFYFLIIILLQYVGDLSIILVNNVLSHTGIPNIYLIWKLSVIANSMGHPMHAPSLAAQVTHLWPHQKRRLVFLLFDLIWLVGAKVDWSTVYFKKWIRCHLLDIDINEISRIGESKYHIQIFLKNYSSKNL